MPIFKTVGQVFQGLALLSIFGMNALMGYILFAPDDLPKPFYLAYSGGPLAAVPNGSSEAGGGEAHATEAASHEPEATSTPEVVYVYEPGQGVMVETGTKIVNLADPGGRRYLKTTIVVEVAPPPPSESKAKSGEGEGEGGAAEDPVMAKFNDEMSKRMPIINDILTTILSSKTFESIYTVEGKEQLRTEVLDTLNERLPSLQVIAVYFTEFVVQ